MTHHTIHCRASDDIHRTHLLLRLHVKRSKPYPTLAVSHLSAPLPRNLRSKAPSWSPTTAGGVRNGQSPRDDSPRVPSPNTQQPTASHVTAEQQAQQRLFPTAPSQTRSLQQQHFCGSQAWGLEYVGTRVCVAARKSQTRLHDFFRLVASRPLAEMVESGGAVRWSTS
jgi:hypothetical protein